MHSETQGIFSWLQLFRYYSRLIQLHLSKSPNQSCWAWQDLNGSEWFGRGTKSSVRANLVGKWNALCKMKTKFSPTSMLTAMYRYSKSSKFVDSMPVRRERACCRNRMTINKSECKQHALRIAAKRLERLQNELSLALEVHPWYSLPEKNECSNTTIGLNWLSQTDVNWTE